MAFAALTVQGEEANGPTMRQKLHAKIMESAPPPDPPRPSVDHKAEEAPPPVVMKPLVVSESKLVREVTAALDEFLAPYLFPEKEDGTDPRLCPNCKEGRL